MSSNPFNKGRYAYLVQLLLLGLTVRDNTLGMFTQIVLLYLVDVILVVPVHPCEVLLHMVRPIELLVTHVALERFLLPVNIFMSIIEVSSVSSVGAVWTDIPIQQ